MKQTITLYIILISLLVFPFLTHAQFSVVKGKVTDEKTSDPLPYVNIGVKGQAGGTFTDGNGAFHLELPKGAYTLMISYVGYDQIERPFTCDGKKEVLMNLTLSPSATELSTLVVSGSKYAQKLEESIASIEVLKAKSIQVSNPTSIDKAIDKIPGITIIDNEPQIRGGSGFSSGLGSRVMVMVDEIPVLRGDAGRPNWGFLPVDDVEQIEVVKGASSVIYGSSAINGAINIRTAYPKDQPETKVNSFLGIYSKPSRKYTTPWSGMNPIQYGIAVSHLQKYDNLDLGVGVNYFADQGYIRGTPEITSDTAFNKGEFERRGKLYFNTRVRNKKIEGLTYGINANIMYSENAQTFFWYDADTNIYRSYPGALSLFKEFSFFVDPYVKYFTKNGNTHSLKNRVYYGNTNANNNQSNRYVTVYNEYQHTHKFKKLGDLMLVAGITNTYSHSNGQVFSGKLAADGTTSLNESGEFNSDNFSVYAQLEKKFFKRLTVLIGGRWEYYQVSTFTENRPVFRLGLNLQASRSTFIRASVGQGYRAPSIGERYITTNSGGFGFYPNPELISEASLSAEVGLKQVFRIGKFGGMFDFAAFYENYDNYIEFNFGVWGDAEIKKSLGFKFINTGPARIYGTDMTVAGEGKIFRNLDLALLLGYTYSVPQALDPNLVYYKHFEQATHKERQYTFNNTSTDTTGSVMKYRLQHTVKSDLQFTYRKKLSAGINATYYSFMKNIDIFLYQLDTPDPGSMHSGVKKYRAEHNKGNIIVNFRVAYALKSFKFSLLVNNLLNTEYSLRPITIESPRVTSLQVVLNI
jgi:iron complex outermembrane receptor protein